jgi:phosphatidylinositol glycan class T
VELWAWVEADDDAAADKRWTTLTNALSGLFCASLNFIDSTRTIRPVLSFQPEGHHANPDRLHLLHGGLPREPVCTENLTPFLKLLPCKGRAGISSLLDGHRLFDAQWQTMSIDVKPVCNSDGSQCRLQVVQTVDMVLDVERSLQRRDSPVPKPRPLDQLNCDPTRSYGSGDNCFPQSNLADLPWSLSEIFGRPLHGSCPLGTTDVCVVAPADRQVFASQASAEIKTGDKRCYTLPQKSDFDLLLPRQSPPLPIEVTPPPLYASRSFTGHGQERGGVQAVIRNPSPTETVKMIYLESLPWFMKPYLHTLKTTIPNSLVDLYYRPNLGRQRGAHLEAALEIPPNSTLTLTYDFDKSVLRYTEYPPDANRGFDIAPAVITTDKGYQIRTTSLLLNLPTPDFSMPYNTIILSSTVMALAFGSVFNLLVRRLVGAEEVPLRGQKLRGLVAKIKRLGEGKRKAE